MNNKQSKGKAVSSNAYNSIALWAKPPAAPTSLLHGKAAHQSGAVLMVSLIMLLLLTIIGVTGSQVTGLEEKMAGNSRDYNLAFQAAESALRAGEAAIQGTPVLYTGTLPIDWTNAAVTTYNGGTLSGVSSAPRYVIEMLSGSSGGGGSCSPCEPGVVQQSTNIAWYRVTALGTGGTSNASVTLQSIYKR